MVDLGSLTSFALAQARAHFGDNVETVRLKSGTDFAGDPALTVTVLVTTYDPTVFRSGRATAFFRAIVSELTRHGDPRFPYVHWEARDLDDVDALDVAHGD
ncbi:MAG: hypothetical protein KJS97_13485 [Alphaproteobacteria bacterium]|nr:hypothetical protein [Alphaproteobacteria bacterium]